MAFKANTLLPDPDDYVERIFMEVLSQYPSLNGFDVLLIRRKLKGATMNARPIFELNNLRGGISTYQIIVGFYVRDSEEIRLEDLPSNVLRGWFAHELGHIMDYLRLSVVGMVVFGFRYLYSDTFRRNAEYAADRYAIRHGFHEEIIEAKRFILENDLLTTSYKEKIGKYYMPVNEVRWHSENPHTLENLFMG